jgi:hypothetical protein
MTGLRAAPCLLLLLLAGCGLDPKLSVLEAKVFVPNCSTSGCHSAEAKAGQLDLSPGHAYAQLVNVPSENVGPKDDGLLRVKPGDPDASFLVVKVRPHLPISYGIPMPSGKPPLTQDELDALAEWVRLGAATD